MQTCDSKENLSGLRKFYLRLEKMLLSADPVAGKDGALLLILFVEAARRIRAARKLDSELLSLATELADALRQVLPGAIIRSVMPEEDLRLSARTASLLAAELERQDRQLLSCFDERIFGYFYQFSCEEERTQALSRIQSADKKSSTADIISFTQLYTPDWVADYLLEKTVIPQWQADGAALVRPRFAPGSQRDSRSRVAYPSHKLTILDPSCGAGHVLLRAFDLMYLLHRAEGRSPGEAVCHILADNLHGCDLDLKALFVCGLSLSAKAMCLSRTHFDFQLKLADASGEAGQSAAGEAQSGSLSRNRDGSHLLSGRYHAVVTNPPYIGRRLLDRRLKQFLKAQYPDAHHDLSAAFLVRALELITPSGKVGFITQSSLLYLPSYGDLRRKFIEANLVESVVELGTHVFPLSAGEKINSMLIVLRGSGDAGVPPACFLDLRNSDDRASQLEQDCRQPDGFRQRDCADFLACRRFAFNYRCPSFLIEVMQKCRKLSEFAEIRQGLATSDNKRFVRYWWDVEESELGKRFHPYIKGAGSERWQAPCQTVLDWDGGGRAIKEAVQSNYPYLNGRVAWVVKNEKYYFRPGLTFSFVSTGNFAVRKMSEGAIFDVGGSALFCPDEIEPLLLSYLNSSFAAACAQLLNPTFNFQVGDIKEIPVPDFLPPERLKLKLLAEVACRLKSELVSFDETGFAYQPGAQIRAIMSGEDPEVQWQSLKTIQAQNLARLSEIEQELDLLIMLSLQESCSLSKSQTKQLSSLLAESQAKGKPASVVFAGAVDFAGAIIRALVDDRAGSQPWLSTDPARPFRDALPPLAEKWLENQLSMPLADYFPHHFNQRQERVFQGCPQVFSLIDSSAITLNFLLSRPLRKLISGSRTNGISGGRLNDEYGEKVCAQVGGKLAIMENWTGKDFYAACQIVSATNNRICQRSSHS
jgi:hypothetical protein